MIFSRSDMFVEIPPFVITQNFKMRLFFHALGLISAGDPVLSSLSMSWNILDEAKNGDVASQPTATLPRHKKRS